jgi:hypothetical protein
MEFNISFPDVESLSLHKIPPGGYPWNPRAKYFYLQRFNNGF